MRYWTPASSSTVSITPVGSATPLPAMSKAQPCATEANRTGTPIVMAEARSGEINLDRYVALVVEHGEIDVMPALAQQQVGADRAVDGEAAPFQLDDGGLGDALVVVAEQAVLAGMRVDAEHADARSVLAEALGGDDDRLSGGDDQLGRQAREAALTDSCRVA